MSKIEEDIRDFLYEIGKEVEDYYWKIEITNISCDLEIEGTSVDGEEQNFSFTGDSLEDLFKNLKEEWS